MVTALRSMAVPRHPVAPVRQLYALHQAREHGRSIFGQSFERSVNDRCD